MSGDANDDLGINARGPSSRDHARRYIESGGTDGARDGDGRACLLLTTRGRRSGGLRRNVLLYARDGDEYVVAGSRGGDDHHPHWYLNLVTDQHVEVWVGADHFDAVARTATGSERERLWPLLTSIMPSYDDFQANTARVIPVVVLARRTGQLPEP